MPNKVIAGDIKMLTTTSIFHYTNFCRDIQGARPTINPAKTANKNMQRSCHKTRTNTVEDDAPVCINHIGTIPLMQLMNHAWHLLHHKEAAVVTQQITHCLIKPKATLFTLPYLMNYPHPQSKLWVTKIQPKQLHNRNNKNQKSLPKARYSLAVVPLSRPKAKQRGG